MPPPKRSQSSQKTSSGVPGSILRSAQRDRLHARADEHPQLRFLQRQLHLRRGRRQGAEVVQRRPRQAIPHSVHQAGDGGGGRKADDLFASPWSPPAFMKTNNDMLHGGKLKPENCSGVGELLHEVHQGVREEGIPIWGISVQNEPMATQTWESCIYYRRRRARLPQELPRPDDEAGRAGGQEDHRLGSQPRSDLSASEHHPRRSRGRAVRVGHRLTTGTSRGAAAT